MKSRGDARKEAEAAERRIGGLEDWRKSVRTWERQCAVCRSDESGRRGAGRRELAG